MIIIIMAHKRNLIDYREMVNDTHFLLVLCLLFSAVVVSASFSGATDGASALSLSFPFSVLSITLFVSLVSDNNSDYDWE